MLGDGGQLDRRILDFAVFSLQFSFACILLIFLFTVINRPQRPNVTFRESKTNI